MLIYCSTQQNTTKSLKNFTDEIIWLPVTINKTMCESLILTSDCERFQIYAAVREFSHHLRHIFLRVTYNDDDKWYVSYTHTQETLNIATKHIKK